MHQRLGTLAGREPTCRLGRQAIRQGLADMMGRVVLFADVPGDQVLQGLPVDACQQFYRLMVIQVAELSADARLQFRWIGPGGEQAGVMVELQDPRVEPIEAAPHMRCDMAGVAAWRRRT